MELLKCFIVSRIENNTGIKVCGLEQGVHYDYDHYAFYNATVPYKDGKRHGIIRGWHYNGQLAFKHSYVNGKIYGLYRIWHKNGQIHYKRSYVNGQYHGLYQVWNYNGLLEYECRYVHGKLQN